MEKENASSFQVVEDPFTSERTGVLRPLHPDVSLIHAAAADSYGNAILLPPYTEIWGTLAAQEGAIVSAERVVSTEVIRRQAAFVRVPGHRVLAVVRAPFGAHPGALYTGEIEGISSYGEDKAFLLEYREACKNRKALEQWLARWILKSHEEYLRELGEERLSCLVGKGQRSFWLNPLLPEGKDLSPPNAVEEMCVLAARKIVEKVKKNAYRVILAGAGHAHLAAWLATYLLRQEGHQVELALEIGMLGSLPRPGDPYIFNLGNLYTATALLDSPHILGACVTADRSLGVLGFAQIDRFGNINTTQYDGFLGGSGGANDVGSGAREVIAVGIAAKRRLAERIEYITTPGKGVTAIVTDRGILEKNEESGEMVFSAYLSKPEEGAENAFARCRETCSWPLKARPELQRLEPCTGSELALLRAFDPEGFLLKRKENRKGGV
jgi:acyl CoA:acetate/3-ketoacid CoA transferase beta subunit